MNALLNKAHLTVVDNTERGALIQQRRLRMGIGSTRKFADALGMDRGAVTKAERGEASENTFLRIETWLDDKDHEMSSESEEASSAAADQVVTIKMAGVYGIEDVTISGPVDHLAELKDLAVELMRDVRERASDSQ